MQIFIIMMGVTKAKQGDLIYSEVFWGFQKSAWKQSFEGWEGVSKVKVNGFKMGGETLEGLYRDAEGIEGSRRERVKVWCDRRFDDKGELASDVAKEVSRGLVVLHCVDIGKGFLFVLRAVACT